MPVAVLVAGEPDPRVYLAVGASVLGVPALDESDTWALRNLCTQELLWATTRANVLSQARAAEPGVAASARTRRRGRPSRSGPGGERRPRRPAARTALLLAVGTPGAARAALAAVMQRGSPVGR